MGGCLKLVIILFVGLMLVGIFAGEEEQPKERPGTAQLQGTAHPREQPAQKAARLEHVKQAERRVLAAKERADRPQEQNEERKRSKTCGPISGKTGRDLENVKKFCEAIQKDLASGIVGSYGAESILWVKISRSLANAMRADRLSTENLVKKWMRRWRKLTGRKAITVYVEWRKVQIAEGATTIFSGDKVTIKE